MDAGPLEDIELSILAAPRDVAFLEPTARHQLRTLSRSPHIARRVLVLDPGGEPVAAGFDELQRSAARLCEEGLLDEWRKVPWDEDAVRATMQRWYGRPDVSPWAGRRRPRYQFAWSVDSSSRPRVLHLDSDVLFHSPTGRWIDRAQEALGRRADAVAVVPMGGVPQARTLVEWILGPGADIPTYPPGWTEGTSVTSRAVLLDRARLHDGLLPLPDPQPHEQWEQDLSRGLAAAGRRCLTHVETEEYFLHPHRHNDFHARHLEGLIALVEAGEYPYRRLGHSWDISTDGRRAVPWWLAIQRRRLANRAAIVRRRSSAETH